MSIRPKKTRDDLKAYREASKQSDKINKRDTQMHCLRLGECEIQRARERARLSRHDEVARERVNVLGSLSARRERFCSHCDCSRGSLRSQFLKNKADFQIER